MAAKYYLDNRIDLDKAEEYMNKSIALWEEPGSTQKHWFYQL